MLPWQRHIRQLNHQKTKVCVVDLLAAIFGDREIKGFREKGEWNTGIKNCVQPPYLKRRINTSLALFAVLFTRSWLIDLIKQPVTAFYFAMNIPDHKKNLNAIGSTAILTDAALKIATNTH